MMVTDGDTLVAVHGGKALFLSTHKHKCPERDSCPSLSPECEAPSKTGFVNHFILSSEPLQGDNVWEQLVDGTIVGIDGRMRTVRAHVDQTSLPLVG
jgi:glutamine amidotransferase